jgi:hypothetical protein
MKNLIIFLFILSLSSCDNDKNSPVLNQVSLDNGVSIYLKSSSENSNLLNTTNFQSSNFKIFYLINGLSVEQNNSSLDYPKNFYINNETNPISMKLFLNHSSTESNPITYIKWNDIDTDTIKVYYKRGVENNTNYEICEKIWLNENLVWDLTTPNGVTGREITILK